MKLFFLSIHSNECKSWLCYSWCTFFLLSVKMGANLGSTKANVFFFLLSVKTQNGCKSWLFYGWRTFFLLSFKIGAYIGFTKAGVFFSCSLSKWVQILAPLRLVYFFPALCQNEANPGSTKEGVFFFLLSVKMGGNLSFTKAGVYFSCSLSKWVQIYAPLRVVYFLHWC